MSVARPRVLFSTGPVKSTDNPYLRELVAGLAAEAEVSFLSPRTALLDRPDVFHVHWPHQLYRADGRLRSRVKALLSGMLLRRLRRRGTPVVLTVHNLASHEPETRREARLRALLERAVTTRVYLNDDPGNDLDRGTVIRHPDYRSWLAGEGIDVAAVAADTPVDRDVVLFGMLRPYKGIEALVEAAPAAPATLTVVGEPTDAAYADRLAALAGVGLEIDARRLDDAELVRAVLRHRLVCLPYPRMYNSGALLFALSVGRPVLVPRSPANEALAHEVGDGWISLYDGPLTAGVLATALARTRSRPALPPLTGRDAATSVRAHLELYRGLLAAGPAAADQSL